MKVPMKAVERMVGLCLLRFFTKSLTLKSYIIFLEGLAEKVKCESNFS